MLQKGKIVQYLTIVFFVVGILEVVSEYLQNKLLIISLKPLIPLLLIVIYIIESEYKNKLFVLVLLSSWYFHLNFVIFLVLVLPYF